MRKKEEIYQSICLVRLYLIIIPLKKVLIKKKIRVNNAMRTKMEKSFKNYCILILTNEN